MGLQAEQEDFLLAANACAAELDELLERILFADSLAALYADELHSLGL